jgi:hypothetical protein
MRHLAAAGVAVTAAIAGLVAIGQPWATVGRTGAPVRLERLQTVNSASFGKSGVWLGGIAPPCVARVANVDPRGNRLTGYTHVPSVYGVAAGAHGVWIVGSRSCRTSTGPALYRLDPRTRRVVAKIPLDLRSDQRRARSADRVAVLPDSVWVALNFGATTGAIVRVDPRTNRIVARIPAGGHVGDIVTTRGGVWFLTDQTAEASKGVSLRRLDPAENRIVATLLRRDLEDVGGAAVLPRLVVGQGEIWTRVFRNAGWVAVRVDTRTNQVTTRALSDRFDPIAAVGGRVWVLRPSGLVGLDRSSLSPAASVALGGSPTAVALDRARGVLWFATRVAHRGDRPKVLHVKLR